MDILGLCSWYRIVLVRIKGKSMKLIIDEKTSKQFWCPVLNSGCLGSDCMKWEKEVAIVKIPETKDKPADLCYQQTSRGYCGY